MKIFKYQLSLNESQHISIPSGARIISLQVQHGTPCIWGLLDPDATMETRTFETYGTGHEIPSIGREYIGSYQSGAYVWHVFENTNIVR